MRTLVAAILAVPVIATTYVPRSLRSAKAFRALLLATVSLATAVALVPGILLSAAPAPAPTTPTPAGGAPGAIGGSAPDTAAHPAASTVIRGVDTLAALGPVEGIAVAAPALRVVDAALRAEAPVAAPPVGASSPGPAASAPVAPSVVRFRPRPGTADVAPTAAVSVRFTQAMSHASTQKAFSATIGGKVVAGTYAWFEGSTVLVLTPRARFPSGATVRLSVSRAARSVAGVALRTASSSSFRVLPATVPSARTGTNARTALGTRTTVITPSGSGLHAVELYYLSLMNCTRTGGWVTSSGACTGAGTRSVKPLVLDAGISDKVSRPYAFFLASRNTCSHFADGNPGDRLSRAGYRNWDWAENIGCLSVDPYRSMLLTHLFYQSEKPYGGGHYRNLMNSLYDRVGIGVEVVHGVLRLVIDFYRP